jgi:hypothetical protein
MLLAPYDMLCADIDAPNLTLLCNVIKPPDHPSCCTAEIQYAVPFLDTKPRGLKYSFHCLNVGFPRTEKAINRRPVTHPKVFRRRGQL